MIQRNSEGLTLSEWHRAAQAWGAKIPMRMARYAWGNGEDPTDWANATPEQVRKTMERLGLAPKSLLG